MFTCKNYSVNLYVFNRITDRNLIPLMIAPWSSTMGIILILKEIAYGRTCVFLSKYNEELYLQTIQKYKVSWWNKQVWVKYTCINGLLVSYSYFFRFSINWIKNLRLWLYLYNSYILQIKIFDLVFKLTINSLKTIIANFRINNIRVIKTKIMQDAVSKCSYTVTPKPHMCIIFFGTICI